eukprot:TRINITY_DN43791_c0_g1_i1.p1 TRINITY_DN43791_c0_g1~~TRINITY_DN43791_c0_g1_i1.p1  ORF type:complete len:398 (-),score=46.33 TRINITY_DN43791_c0_g1_i1:109-1257(-)
MVFYVGRTAFIFLAATLLAVLAELTFYGDRVDPMDTRHNLAMQQEDGSVLQVEVQNGKRMAIRFHQATDQIETFELSTDDVLSLGIPREALYPIVTKDAWKQRLSWTASTVPRVADPECPRRGEGHLQKSTVDVLQQLDPASLRHKAINIGGMYGAGSPNDADDPVVEVVRAEPKMQVLCIGCGDFRSIERLSGHTDRIVTSALQNKWDSDFASIPQEWHDVDVLRLENVPAGLSCLLLRSILQVIRAKVIVLLVHGQVPPPIQFSPIRDTGSPTVGEAFYSCSVSAVSSVVRDHGFSLLRLSGPYALFVRESLWTASTLPLNEAECFRHVEAYGVDLFPIEFVRDWLFNPHVVESVARVHGNVSQALADFGHPGEPFMLAA